MHLSGSNRQYVEAMIDRLKKEFLRAGGTIDDSALKQSRYIVEEGLSEAGYGVQLAAGVYKHGQKSVIEPGRGANLGTLAEELLHWKRNTKGLSSHPEAQGAVDDILVVMQQWGFKKVK